MEDTMICSACLEPIEATAAHVEDPSGDLYHAGPLDTDALNCVPEIDAQ